MAQTYPMDRIIRLVDEGAQSRGSAEVLVQIDVDRRVVLPKPPMWTFGMHLRRYIIGNTNDPRNSSEGELPGYILKSLEHNVSVSVKYAVRCGPGREARVALALLDETASPGEVLDRHLGRWLTELGEPNIPQFVRDYLEDRPALEARIAARALAETGLDLSVRLFLDAERSLNTLTVAKDHLRVVVADFHNEEQDLGFRSTLDVSERDKANAILYYRHNPQLQELVPREIVRFVKQSVSMQTYCTNVNSPDVLVDLAAHLDKFLAPYGRKIGTLRLDAKPCGFEFFFQHSHDVTCALREYPKPVVIQNKVQMLLQDVACYKSSNSPDLRDWLQRNLDRIVRQFTFGKKYIDVLIRFEPIEKQIKQAMRNEAKTIGYQVEQLITVPDLEPIRWKDPFPLNVSGAFETQTSRFEVNVQFLVTARIPDLNSVEEYLNREQNVPKLMEEEILSAVSQLLHSVHPERFYMRFFHSPDAGKEPPVKEALVEAIDKALRTKFGAQIINVVVKVVETDLMARLKKLMETICPFVVELVSLHGDETLVFHGNFQVQGVDPGGWPRFYLMTSSIDRMRRLIEDHLLAQLQAATPAALKFRSLDDRRHIELLLSQFAQEYVRDEFGLIIRVTNVYRDPTPHEIVASKRLLARDAKTLEKIGAELNNWYQGEIAASDSQLARLKTLLERRRQLSTATDVEEDLRELDDQIDQLRTAMRPADVTTAAEVQQRALPPPPPNNSLSDLARMAGIPDLLDAKPKKTIEEGVE
jgi:hypothetical protein